MLSEFGVVVGGSGQIMGMVVEFQIMLYDGSERTGKITRIKLFSVKFINVMHYSLL